jgi:hypothetical protein
MVISHNYVRKIRPVAFGRDVFSTYGVLAVCFLDIPAISAVWGSDADRCDASASVAAPLLVKTSGKLQQISNNNFSVLSTLKATRCKYRFRAILVRKAPAIRRAILKRAYNIQALNLCGWYGSNT